MTEAASIPAAMVKRMLEMGSAVAERTAARAAEFASARTTLRSSLSSVIGEVDDDILDAIPSPSVSAVDGALVCDSKSIGDLCTAVAVSVGPGEGDGGSDVWMDSVNRSPQNKEVLSGIMSTMEVGLSTASAAEVVLMDGAILGTLINVSKAVHSAQRVDGPLRDRVLEAKSAAFRERVMSVLSSPRYVAVPKYTTTNEFAEMLPTQFRNHDARTIATMALRPGEMTFLMPRNARGRGDARQDVGRQLIGPALGVPKEGMEAFSDALGGTFSCYYRPHAWTPAFRLDMTPAAFDDEKAQVRAFRAVRDSTRTSGLREPFPLYLVDLFAKQISVGAAPIVEMSALTSIEDPDARLLLAMGYRS